MLRLEDFADLAATHADALKARVHSFELRGRLFDGNTRPELMGVINLSADSWYRESVALTAEAAIRRGRVLAVGRKSRRFGRNRAVELSRCNA